jgi:hypothetical protein
MIARARIHIALSLALVIGALAPVAHAQTSVATFVSLVGGVEVQRDGKGEWQPATLGGEVYSADAVRSAAGAFAKLLFTDQSVINLGPASQLSIEWSVSSKGPRRVVFHLAQGAILALASGYGAETARFEVETPTALARVQGTQFIVRYDPAEQATEVVGIDGTVAVQGTTGIIGPGVSVGANEMTHVPRDGFPSPVKTLDEAQMRQALQGVQLVGSGVRDGLDTDNPLVDGRIVAATDRPPAGAAGAPAGGPYLQPGIPGYTLLYSLSPDIRANNQPLPEYQLVPPNQSPNPPR